MLAIITRDQREGGDVGVVGEDVHQPVDLAALIPIGRADEIHGRAGVEQWRRGEERQAAGDKIDDAARPRLAAPLPQPQQLERQHADAVDAERRQVAEEQQHDARGRQRKAHRPGALAQRDPAGQRPQRDADAEDVVHQADEKNVIVEQRNARTAETPTSGRPARG